jgi:5-methylcytosine-specific restriction endonuclease McrA
MYTKVYSWPHSVSPYSYLHVDRVSGKQYCWKHLQKMQENAEIRSIRTTQLIKTMDACNNCGRLFPERAGYKIKGNLYCVHCIEGAVEQQFMYCQICNKKTASFSSSYCYDCYPISRVFASQVSQHLGRAKAANTPATLTIKQWITTVNYFHEKCAYCQSRPFQVLEHFLPISLGGGTTADNCVPACQQCNSKKGSAHPDKLIYTFPQHVIDRIKNYLQSDKQNNPPRIHPSRELIVLNG